MADIINASFEFVGIIAVWLNIRAILRDRQVKGVSVLNVLFFSIWGFWNIYYYPSLEQFWSGVAAGLLAASNSFYFFLVMRFKNAR